ncbi:MAG: hypothetical protein D6702_06190 [Planctomycetota bacterium]|nr:MAG: hypothetical protein D6702_06190 [Planctomycetota bacterium]
MAVTLLSLMLAAAAQGGGLLPPPVPPGNPITQSKVLLGKTLFWDEQLSSTRTVSCGSCHLPEAGGSDPRSLLGGPAVTHPGPDGVFGTPDDVLGSPGVVRSDAAGLYVADPVYSLAPQVTPRRSMGVVNAAYSPQLFWDGRADQVFRDPITNQVVLGRFAALESQVLGPPVSEVEMGHEGRDWNDVAARIAAAPPLALSGGPTPDLAAWLDGRDYPALFLEAFGTPEVTPSRIAMAIASYERTLVSDQAPIFAFLAGNTAALTPQEQRGFALFNSPRLACNLCHFGPRFTDDQFRYTGVRPQAEDPGRAAVTGDPADEGAMKVPSLLNVALRPPYFHGGQAADLAAVVDFYDRGGDFDGPNKPPTIHPLGLSAAEKADLLAFLGRPLTDPRLAARQAPFDRPVLYAESGRQPRLYGRPTAGAAGIEPVMVAAEPPLAGNPSLTIGLDHGRGGALAALVVDTADDPLGHPVQGALAFLALGPDQVRHLIQLDGAGPGGGTASFSFTVPAGAAVVGQRRYAQWFVADPGAPGGLAASAAAEFTVF